MFHLDPARRNRSPFRGPANPTITSVTELQDPIQTAPAVLHDGTVVVATLGGNVVGIRDNGQIAFTTRLGDRVYASPLVIGERFFLGTDDDRFVAMSSSGNVLWSLATDGDADTSGTPTPDHGIVFAAHDTVYFVRKDGSVVWRVRAKRKIFSSPAVAEDGTVYVGAQDNRLYGIRRTGTLRFAVDLGNDVDCAPAIDDDGTVFVGTDGGAVVAVAGDSGKERWRTPVGGHVRGGLTVTRSHDVVAGVYGPSPRVVTLRGDTGEMLWSFAVPGTGAREFGVHGSPVEDADGNLYFGAQDDAVYALTANGELRWKIATGGDVDAPIVLLADGVVLAASDDGKLYRIEERCDEE
jgi:outer membrane protein assembly factor BamB